MENSQVASRKCIDVYLFHEALKHVAWHDHWGPVVMALAALPVECDSELLDIACRMGSLDFIIWAHNHPHLYPMQQSLPTVVVVQAIRHGHTHILEWARNHFPQQQIGIHYVSPELLSRARQGDLATLQLGFDIAQVQEGDETWMQCLIEACQAPGCQLRDSWYIGPAKPQHLQVICWLASHLQPAFAKVFQTYYSGMPASKIYKGVSQVDRVKVDRIVAACDCRMLPVQLAATEMQPRIPWNYSNIIAAYHHGDEQVLLASHALFAFGRLM